MIHPIDLNRDLDELTMLRDRGPHTTEEEAQASIAKLADFRDGGVFASHFSGKHGWERHPKGDEIVQILQGTTQFDIIIDDVMQSFELSAGMLLVVPKGCWHRFESEHGVKLLTATPPVVIKGGLGSPRFTQNTTAESREVLCS